MSKDELNFLVLDDDDFLRLTTANMLRPHSSKPVLEASDGKMALEILRRQDGNSIDIVLCDLNMPGMDGMEFLRHLGKNHPDVSVVIISSHDGALIGTVKKMAAAYNVRLLGAIQKPLSPLHIEAFISRHRALQSRTSRQAATPDFTIEDILNGIEQKQFEPFYQPKVGFKTGIVHGAEALARWIHPEHGVISPYAFIEPLEKSDNIEKLTYLIMEKSIAACRLLHDNGHPLSVSVNLSPSLLDNPDLADKILRVVRDAGINPNLVMFEITESAAMLNVAHSLENLARLRMHGFPLSIDDYGTGFSNIQQMMRIDFRELKIDQSFIRDCADNNALGIIVKSSIEMAHQLEIQCVAEGIETEKDWETVKGMGCDLAQGYFIARPMNLESLVEFCAGYGRG
ncbi:MAG: EAL domain-containing response regulator [Alphaproteobacteria bacterium]